MTQVSNAAKILIIEHDIQINRVLQSVFSVSNRITIATYLLEDALKVAERNCLHTIIFDLELPDGEGWKTIDRIQAALSPEAHPQFVIIAPSELRPDTHWNKNGYRVLPKPVSINELVRLTFQLRYEHRP